MIFPMGMRTAALLAATAWAAFSQTQSPVPADNKPVSSAGPGSAAAEAAATSPAAEVAPSADQILERWVRALGGRDALQKINSRDMKGKFEAPAVQLTGDAEILTAAPDLFISRVTLADGAEFIAAFDGKVGWSSDPRSGPHEMQGAELENMRRSSQFEHELRFRQIFPEIRVLEKSAEQGQAVWILEATPPGGFPEKFYFDAGNGLLLRHDSLQYAEGAAVPIEHYYADYSPVDGVMVPHLLRHKDPHVEWQVTFTEVRQNLPVDAARFTKPAAP